MNRRAAYCLCSGLVVSRERAAGRDWSLVGRGVSESCSVERGRSDSLPAVCLAFEIED